MTTGSEERSRRHQVAIVSCDIVGHSSSSEPVQVARVSEINRTVAEFIGETGPDGLVWASGGDGGHLVFRQERWEPRAVDMVGRLLDWSREKGSPLRVTAHYGWVTHIEGADGRIQVVGEAINTAGWMLKLTTENGVVASDAFHQAVVSAGNASRLRFHDSRFLRDKSGHRRTLLLMSGPSWESRWAAPFDNDRAQLDQALSERNGWRALHLIKRLLQVNTADAVALNGLRKITPMKLSYTTADGRTTVNPFLVYLDPSQFREVVQLGQLVERRYNDIICRYGDKGDTMFIILSGEVGVYKSEGEGPGNPSEPFAVHGEGDIVGELAFTLARNRTADLVALSDVALLSFSLKEVDSRLSSRSDDGLARNRIDRFINSRVLEHVSNNVDFLLGVEKNGPLARGEESWQEALESMLEHTRLLSTRPQSQRLKFDHDERVGDGVFEPGLYILAAGKVRAGGQDLSGETFPLVWVNIPDVVVLPERTYEITANPVKILRIDPAALDGLEPAKRGPLHKAIRRAAAKCYRYDAFLSYNSSDREIAEQWAEAFRQRGLHVYIDGSHMGHNFSPRLQEALLDARALVAFVSHHVKVRSNRYNWVLRETRFYQDYFGENAQILPIRLAGGDVEQIASGFPPIDVQDDEPSAIDRASEVLGRLRDGVEDPPYILRSRGRRDLS
ncbi:cyclic nucleotide-binding domain-containing protein [Sphaerisporangium corydalis]|uniref:Cyclic nucleotide-binding domain-containing protein n=1 Tax=Sphaerisporangium corydalis TaxID=1441875 RepID=A0ABV9EBB8_9ACTN|nr:cyclic nucleotide-binding domain-containing protein [Sphaerisporangium corydalis]